MALKKAENLKEAHRAFETQEPLDSKQKDFYVDLYENDINKLRKELVLNSIPNKTFFLTGQSGNGKSTSLNFLPDHRINNEYEVKYLYGRNVFDLEDVDVIDVIIMIGFTIIKDNPKLEKRFFEDLEELRKVNEGSLIKEQEEIAAKMKNTGAKISAGAGFSFSSLFKVGTDFSTGYRIDRHKREMTRQIFQIDKQKLIKKINNIILAFQQTLKDNKKLLLIIDDMEKMRDPKQTRELFVDNEFIFSELLCTKIVTFPIHLATRHAMFKEASKFGLRISPNPMESNDNGEIEQNRNKLKKVINNRLANQDIVSPDAAELAVTYSGGNLRLLMNIMQKAVLNAFSLGENQIEEKSVTSRDIENAVESIAELPSLSVMKRVKMLQHIMEKHQQPDDDALDDDFIRSVLDNTIFAYFNGAPWYDLNPTIKKSVETYIANASKESGP